MQFWRRFGRDRAGNLTVQNETSDFHRYIDPSAQGEALFECMRKTIDVELIEERR
jgi:hypothetical protein